MFSIAKLKQKQIITKHFVTFFTKKLTFCHLIDLNQENMVCLFGFVVLDNMKRWVSMCPITPQCCMSRKKKCRSRSGERQFFFFLYLIYMYGTSWL